MSSGPPCYLLCPRPEDRHEWKIPDGVVVRILSTELCRDLDTKAIEQLEIIAPAVIVYQDGKSGLTEKQQKNWRQLFRTKLSGPIGIFCHFGEVDLNDPIMTLKWMRETFKERFWQAKNQVFPYTRGGGSTETYLWLKSLYEAREESAKFCENQPKANLAVNFARIMQLFDEAWASASAFYDEQKPLEKLLMALMTLPSEFQNARSKEDRLAAIRFARAQIPTERNDSVLRSLSLLSEVEKSDNEGSLRHLEKEIKAMSIAYSKMLGFAIEDDEAKPVAQAP